MQVSLTMIVKDEVENLNECLDSIYDYVDEVVIVDTGSTDGTLEIVKERADVWDQIPWTGFADARNRAIELASGDVCVVLDADERLIVAPGWDDALEALENGADGVAFVIRNKLPDHQLLTADRMWQVRMWWNRPEAYWTGRVHNQLTQQLKDDPRDGKEAKFFQAKIQLDHTGYALSSEQLKKKYEARLEDLKKEIEEAENEQIKAYYQFQTSNAYFMLDEKMLSLRYARECAFEELTAENKYSLAMMAVSSCHALELTEESVEWAKKLMDIWPKEVMSFLMMGLAHLSMGHAQAAYNFLGSVLALCQLKGMDYKYMIDPHYVAGAAGEAALAMNRLGEAKELFQMHLEKHDTPKIKELENAIIPMNEARERGLVDQDGREIDHPQEEPATEAVGIPDLRKTG